MYAESMKKTKFVVVLVAFTLAALGCELFRGFSPLVGTWEADMGEMGTMTLEFTAAGNWSYTHDFPDEWNQYGQPDITDTGTWVDDFTPIGTGEDAVDGTVTLTPDADNISIIEESELVYIVDGNTLNLGGSPFTKK